MFFDLPGTLWGGQNATGHQSARADPAAGHHGSGKVFPDRLDVVVRSDRSGVPIGLAVTAGVEDRAARRGVRCDRLRALQSGHTALGGCRSDFESIHCAARGSRQHPALHRYCRRDRRGRRVGHPEREFLKGEVAGLTLGDLIVGMVTSAAHTSTPLRRGQAFC